MKIQTILAGLTGLLIFQTAMASEFRLDTNLPLSQVQNLEGQDESSAKNINRMMGHLTFAAQAIDLEMKKSALLNLKEAKKLCAALEKLRPELISKNEYQYGKTTYSISGVDRDYYIPVVENFLLEGTFDEKAIWRKNPKVEEKALTVVHSKFQLNLREVYSSIIATENLLRVDKYDDARRALEGVFKDAVASEEIVSSPVWTVWGNLVLAQNFLQGGQFKNVRFALNAAKSDLLKLEKEQILSKNGNEARSLKAELDDIEKTLTEKDPSIAKRIQTKLKEWAHKVKAWI